MGLEQIRLCSSPHGSPEGGLVDHQLRHLAAVDLDHGDPDGVGVDEGLVVVDVDDLDGVLRRDGHPPDDALGLLAEVTAGAGVDDEPHGAGQADVATSSAATSASAAAGAGTTARAPVTARNPAYIRSTPVADRTGNR